MPIPTLDLYRIFPGSSVENTVPWAILEEVYEGTPNHFLKPYEDGSYLAWIDKETALFVNYASYETSEEDIDAEPQEKTETQAVPEVQEVPEPEIYLACVYRLSLP